MTDINSSSLLINSNTATNAYLQSNQTSILGDHLYKRVTVSNGVQSMQFGSNHITFDIEPGGPSDYLSDARIYISISALTPGTSATYTYFCNAVAIFMFSEFRLFSQSKEIMSVSADQVFRNMFLNTTSDVWSRLATNIGYNSSTSARAIMCQSPQYFSIDLKYLFNHFSKPLNIFDYGKLQLKCYPRTSSTYIIQTNSTTPASFSFTNLWLDCQYVNTPYNIIKMNNDLLLKNQKLNYDIGFINQSFNLPAGQTQYVLNMSSILYMQNVIDISVILRLSSNIDTTNTSEYLDNIQPVYSWNIKSSDKYVNGLDSDMVVNEDYYNLILPRLHLVGINQVVNQGINSTPLIMSFASDENFTNVDRYGWTYNGSKIFNYQNAQITLNLSTAPTAPLTATVLVRTAKLCSNKAGQLFVF